MSTLKYLGDDLLFLYIWLAKNVAVLVYPLFYMIKRAIVLYFLSYFFYGPEPTIVDKLANVFPYCWESRWIIITKNIESIGV